MGSFYRNPGVKFLEKRIKIGRHWKEQEIQQGFWRIWKACKSEAEWRS
jgi:hypothetical protein